MTQQAKEEKKSPLKRVLEWTIQYLLPMAVTVLLVIVMFKKVSFSEMLTILSQGVNYWWILLAMILSIFSHVARAARWRLQLRGMDCNPPFLMLCCSIFGTYGLNLLFPRAGEVWRCAYVARHEHKPFTKVIGSMVADRLTDTITVALLTVFTFCVASGAINAFLEKYPIGQDIIAKVQNPWFWIGITECILGLAILVYALRHTKIFFKAKEWLIQIWKGFAVIGSMEGKWKFLILTFAIWGCYFVQMYLAFFAFDFTRALCAQPGLAFGLTPCLVAWILSSIGMAVPSNGGLGPWNIACMFGLAIYGISDPQGAAFSMVVWSSETVMLILLGIFTMGYIMVHKKR